MITVVQDITYTQITSMPTQYKSNYLHLHEYKCKDLMTNEIIYFRTKRIDFDKNSRRHVLQFCAKAKYANNYYTIVKIPSENIQKTFEEKYPEYFI